MTLSSHFSSGVSDPFLDSLKIRLNRCSASTERVEENLSLPVEEDPRLVRRYLYLYTIPLLEAAGILNDDHQTATWWASVQVCLSLHLRSIDNILDEDRINGKIIDHARKAHLYLAHAQSLLHEKGRFWGSPQAVLYAQFYEYEIEVRDGMFHDFSSLWRRVSPLCVIPETYLGAQFATAGLAQCYRSFLSWSLLHADCDDVLKDLRCGCTTPVTRLVQEKTNGVFHDFAAGAEVLDKIKSFLKRHSESLRSALQLYPLWATVLDEMDRAMTNGSSHWKAVEHDDNHRHQ